MRELETDVLIVGGAGAGLTAAIELSRKGVSYHLIERYPAPSPAPKAHYLNPRTMEIFRAWGIEKDVASRGTPPEHMARVGWYTSLGGDGELDRKRIHIMDAFGGGSLREAYERHSPCWASNYPQLRLEPLLLEHARSYDGADLNYGRELQSFEQDANGVTAVIAARGGGEAYRVRAKYMIAADGGRTVGPALGVEMQGAPRLFDMVTAYFAADLSAYIDDDSPMIRWFNNPERGGSWGSGVMVALGPERYDRYSREWLFHFAFLPDDPAQFDETSVVPQLRELLRLPDTEITILKMNNWQVQGVLAERFRVGRVFLVGDAGHRHPPTTGLGLNSAIQDVHNLVWKLARVLRGEAGDALLDTYESERRPVCARNVEWALLTFQNHAVFDLALGLIPNAPVEVNRNQFRTFFSDTPIGATRRALMEELGSSQRVEFQAHDVEIGFYYETGALVGDGTAPPPRDPLGTTHHPTTRPGHRMPHAWLERGGERLSTHDLIDGSRFVLITGDARAWVEAAAQAGCEIAVEEVTAPAWVALNEIERDGAVLVRPDGHVGWRVTACPADPARALKDAMSTILAL